MKSLMRSKKTVFHTAIMLTTAALLTGCGSGLFESFEPFQLFGQEEPGVLLETTVNEPPELIAGAATETRVSIGVLEGRYNPDSITEEEVFSVSDGRVSVVVGDDEEEKTELIDFPESCYGYSQLSYQEKLIYVEIYRNLCDRGGEVVLSSLNTDEVDKVFNCVMIDHPEIFYVSGYRLTKMTMGGELTSLSFAGRYTMTKAEMHERQKAIEDYVNRFLAEAPRTDDEYVKVKYIFDYLVGHTEFDLNSEDNQNICSVFINGRTVCQGYSMAAKYLADELNVFATLAYGSANGTGHAWNIFRINGVYCHVDVTWGDASYHSAYEDESQDITDYVYLGADDDIIGRQHEPDYFIPMPKCTSLEQYYYVREGRYFGSFDREKLKELFAEAYDAGEAALTIRCADQSIYDEMSEELFDAGKVFTYLKGSSKARFVRNDEELTISFLL